MLTFMGNRGSKFALLFLPAVLCGRATTPLYSVPQPETHSHPSRNSGGQNFGGKSSGHQSSGDQSSQDQASSRNAKSGVLVSHTDFHGWPAIVLRNRVAEVIVVPDIGRVMQFNLLDDSGNSTPGPFWNHPAIDKKLAADGEGWTNYGGDKVWPAPQSDWPKVAGRSWPPPAAFDAAPYSSSIKGKAIELVSGPDPGYGIRVHRTIVLHPLMPMMTIETMFEKVSGAPVRAAVWTITQLMSPDRAFMLLPPHTKLPGSYASFLPSPPKDLKIEGRLLSVVRDPENKTMVGGEGNCLLWVGAGPDLLIGHEYVSSRRPRGRIADAEDQSGAEWPDRGSHAKIYTNSDDQKYVELEFLDPLQNLSSGAKALMRSSYTLIRRTERDPFREAQKVLEQELRRR